MLETWDENVPRGTDDKRLGDDAIRQFKRAIRERFAIEHYASADEGNIPVGKVGRHKPEFISAEHFKSGIDVSEKNFKATMANYAETSGDRVKAVVASGRVELVTDWREVCRTNPQRVKGFLHVCSNLRYVNPVPYDHTLYYKIMFGEQSVLEDSMIVDRNDRLSTHIGALAYLDGRAPVIMEARTAPLVGAHARVQMVVLFI